MFRQKGILLGLVEVRIPLRHLEKVDLNRISQICYRKLLDLAAVNDDETIKCIGVVDSFYALQEVELIIEEGICKVFSKNDLVLRNSLKNVLVAVHSEYDNRRIIVISKTENFGPAAVVLQLMDNKTAHVLIEHLSSFQNNDDCRNDNNLKRGTGSFGKSVHKKLHSIMSSMSSRSVDVEDRIRLGIPRSVSAPVSPIQLSEEDEYTSEADDDSSGHEEESNYSVSNSSSMEKINTLSRIEMEIDFLLESEKKYLDVIHNILHIQSEIENTNSILEYPVSIFDNVEELHKLHTNLYTKLMTCKFDVSKICSVFIANKNNFDVYISFISNIETVEKIVEVNRQIIVREFPSLIEDLRKPRMRLNFYVLTLESFLKKSCVNTHQIINECILMLKDKLKEADTRLVIDSVHGVSFDLRAYGRVVFYSELTLKKGNGLIRRRYQAILLEDVLILARGTQQSSEYHMSFSVMHMQLIRQLRGLYIYLKIRIREKISTFVFKAATIKLQQKWINFLQSQIHKANKDYLTAPMGINRLQNFKRQEINIPTINIVDCDEEITNDDSLLKLTTPVSHIVPLSFWGTFSSMKNLHLKSFYSFEENLQAFVKSARAIKIKELESQVKSVNAKEIIILLKEFYVKQLIPSVNLSIFNEEDILYRSIENSSNYFKSLVTKLAYYFSVLCDESCTQLPNVFIFAIETVVYLRNAFIVKKCQTEVERKNCKNVKKIFSDAINNCDKKLKRRYISNIYSTVSTLLLHEGVLTLFPENPKPKKLYVFLTPDRLFAFGSQVNNSDPMQINVNLDDATIISSSDTLHFQILVKNDNHVEQEFTFGCSTKGEKNEWIFALESISDKHGQIATVQQ